MPVTKFSSPVDSGAPKSVAGGTFEAASRRIEAGLAELNSAAFAENWMERVETARTEAPVSINELTSLSALIAYVAHKTGGSEFGVERRLADRFNVANVKVLPASRFDDALRYLADQVA